MAEIASPIISPICVRDAEDWGWAVIVEFENAKWTVAVGIVDDSIGQSPAEWRVSVAYEKSLNGVGAIFRKRPIEAWERLLKATLVILKSNLDPNATFITIL